MAEILRRVLVARVVKDAIPVFILVTLVALGCAYFLVIDDYVADTGPILTRALACLLGQALAICIGSGIATFRAEGAAFARGAVAGIAGSTYFTSLLWIIGLLSGPADASGLTFVFLFGATAAVVGAVGGLIVRGP
jgi:hypothetical protein